MAQLNQVIIIGNLVREPETRFVPSGQAVCNLRVATSRKYKAAGQDWKEETTYLNIEYWGKGGEYIGENAHKGSAVVVVGRLKNKEWTAQDGQKRSEVMIVADRVQFAGPKVAGEPEVPFGEEGGAA